MARILLYLLRSNRRFRKDPSGAAAIEFAIVAMPFFALTFAIFEVALSFFFTQIMETAAADASRLIMTGQVAAQNMTPQQFRNEVCGRLPPLFDCQGSVHIDVQNYSSFGGASNGSLLPTAQERWNPGNPQDIVVVRVSYEMPVFMNFYGASLANYGENYLITATSAFRNEPFVAPAGGGAS